MTADSTNQGVTQEEVASPQPAELEAQQQDSQQINWQKANETMAEQKQRLEQLERQNQTYQQQLQMVQQHMTANQSSSAQSEDPLNGIGDEDVLTGADFKRALGGYLQTKEKQFEERLNQQSSQLSIMQMKAQYPDYEDVVRQTVNMAERDPALAEALRTSSNPGLLAYRLGKSAQPQQNQQSEQAQRIVENSKKPGSITQASTGSSALSKADFFLNMSDKDFEAHVAKVKRGQY